MASSSSLSIIAFSVIFCSMLLLTFAGFTKEGGYIGKYPGGCMVDDECPIDENCIDDRDEIPCKEGDDKNCRCMMGCVYQGKYLRYEQWRPIPGDGYCKCKTAGRLNKREGKGGEIDCNKHIDL